MKALSRLALRESILPVLLVVFFIVCMLAGGASRADAQTQIVVRIAAAILSAAALLTFDTDDIRRLRVPFGLAAAWTALIAIQLVPLPPALWIALPGRSLFVDAASSAGLEQPWRPLSLTPDLTLNSLVSLLPLWAVLLTLAVVPIRCAARMLPIWLAIAAASALLGILQLAGGSSSPLYFYAITNPGDPVGFFANRNHQAVLLALALPLTMVWTAHGIGTGARPPARIRSIMGVAVIMLLILVLIVCGSRSGMGLMLFGMLGGVFLIGRREALSFFRRDRLWLFAAISSGLIFAVALLANSRAQSILRLVNGEKSEDLRISNLPLTFEMAKDYFPVGSGFGSFDPMFRIVEPDSALSQTYFNHAHNDLLELVITGGLPALLILAAFLMWWAKVSWAAWRSSESSSVSVALARSGSISIALLLLASLVDYPLRTPLATVFFASAVVWLASKDGALYASTAGR